MPCHWRNKDLVKNWGQKIPIFPFFFFFFSGVLLSQNG
jgi:hypothetical protein